MRRSPLCSSFQVLLAIGLIGPLVGCRLAAPSGAPDGPVPIALEDVAFHCGTGYRAVVRTGIDGEWQAVCTFGSANSVVVQWSRRSEERSDAFVWVAEQRVSLRYMPTASSFFGAGVLAFAGIDDTGAVVIESIALEGPTVDAESGAAVVQPPAHVVEFSAFLPGYIAGFRRAIGARDRVLASLFGVGLLVELDLENDDYSIVAAQDAPAGVLDYPHGQFRWPVEIDGYDFGPSGGHVYVVWEDPERSTFPAPVPHPRAGAVDPMEALDFYLDQYDLRAPVVFIDANRDGTIDASQLLDEEDFPRRSLFDSSPHWVVPWNEAES